MAEDREALLAANAAFYRAFSERDLFAMAEVWAEEAPVACVHPGWSLLEGRERVLASFQAIFANDPPALRSKRPIARVGPGLGYVLCQEVLPGGVLEVTNVFQQEKGAWRLVHHQAGPVAPGEDDGDEGPGPLKN